LTKSSNYSNIENFLKSKLKIIILLFIAFLSVFLVLTQEMSTDNIGHSQIMPANISNKIIENNTLFTQVDEENVSSPQSVTNNTQNSNATGVHANSALTNTSTNNTNTLDNTTTIQSQLPQVKIISHTKGQKVPEGTLSINGVSTDNSGSTCDVYVILNSIKPYQKVTPTGQSGASSTTKDYSQWKFTFLPTYGLITEGENKMTAKITCMNGNVNATKFNSLNVTGISSNLTNSNTSLPQTVDPLQSPGNITTTDNPESVGGNSTSLMSTYPPSAKFQQVPSTGGITPQTSQPPQTNYYGITPHSSTAEEIPAQNSSFIQEEQVPSNSISDLEEDSEQDDSQLDLLDREISTQTKKAVDEFIARVQGTVEERLEEAIKLRNPFELVTPTPFDSDDD
jgi:hypothetical protein